VTLDRTADLTDADREELRRLTDAVYPPDESSAWAGRQLEWAPAEYCVRVRHDGGVASYVGIVLRDAEQDGRPVRVGGIGGVKTHPAARARGLAARGVARAMAFFHEQPAVAFGLLVCAPHLLAYYARLGWREFRGRMIVRQHGVPVDFAFNRIMTCAVRSPAPEEGTIDLMGPPW